MNEKRRTETKAKFLNVNCWYMQTDSPILIWTGLEQLVTLSAKKVKSILLFQNQPWHLIIHKSISQNIITTGSPVWIILQIPVIRPLISRNFTVTRIMINFKVLSPVNLSIFAQMSFSCSDLCYISDTRVGLRHYQRAKTGRDWASFFSKISERRSDPL